MYKYAVLVASLLVAVNAGLLTNGPALATYAASPVAYAPVLKAAPALAYTSYAPAAPVLKAAPALAYTSYAPATPVLKAAPALAYTSYAPAAPVLKAAPALAYTSYAAPVHHVKAYGVHPAPLAYAAAPVVKAW
ncbi:cuticle protein 38-like [Copidosoma floridanum]|uniref:cuticle protein 38-like n=1 Tax=Copidosoma floridanum TaxID=29053 RepID=UPI000C6F60ED|nr:cuticle protein 38-like [Copidosoma floridanum]